ncbi:(2Fe-2S)-binding protein [Oceanobacillus sp. HCA-5259]|uniref:(2Fe-2S)-binding protein n=1 Tax=Oceanobacillus sp. HCA-5259 TaxID=3134661 RepID=UPI0030C486CA
MDRSTIICRCEELSREEIEEAIENGARTFNDIKRLTRCGMGPCQSKICSDLVLDIIYQKTGKEFSTISLPRMRPPLVPVKLGTLAKDSSSGRDISFRDADSILDEGR